MKPVVIDGVAYPSIAAAARSLGISHTAAWLRANPDKRRTARKSWTDHVLSAADVSRRLTEAEQDALTESLQTMSLRAAAQKHGVCSATAARYRKKN